MRPIEEIVNPKVLWDSDNKRIKYAKIISPLSAYMSAGQSLEVWASVCHDGSISNDALIGEIHLRGHDGWQVKAADMQFVESRGENCIFSGRLSIDGSISGSILYTAKFSDDNGKTWKYAEDDSGEMVYRNLTIGPDWFRKANIYQIYPRLYKNVDDPAKRNMGTFINIKNDLLRIKSLNIDTIWLMPIHPIGKVNRKGELGSLYAIRDYFGVNPELVRNSVGKDDEELEELGKQQLKELIDTAHRDHGMKVILSFVGNHCAPDNVLLDPNNPEEKGGYHPEWFFMDEDGVPNPPNADWSDTVDIKYGAGIDEIEKPKYPNDGDRKAMWNFMISVLKYWVEEFDVDGFRCDFAHWIPLAFWRQAINEVKRIKSSVVFIGEVYERTQEHLEIGFDAIYHFELYNQLKSLYYEIKNNDPYYEIPYIPQKIKHEDSAYPKGYRLFRYTENHDEIRAAEMYGSAQAAQAPTLMSFTLPGVPFIYIGQESGETIRPSLFIGDREATDFPKIDFNRDPALTEWYCKVMRIRKDNLALTDGDLEFMESSNRKVLAYSRVAGESKIIVAINFDYTDGDTQWANLKIANNLGIEKSTDAKYQFYDILNEEAYTYDGSQLNERLVVGLEQFKSHIFVVTEEK